VTPRQEGNRRLLKARDAMDRYYADGLDIEALAASVHLSRAHFIRSFRATFGETPHRYLQRRRLERAMALLRETDRPVTEICLEVGFASLGSFSRTFREVVGMSPRAYRKQTARRAAIPGCIVMAWDRPSGTFGEERSAKTS
jgi:AraC-like DNA-binding protein